MKKILPVILSAGILFSCNTRPEQEGFTLTGTIKNIPDSSMVYMDRDNTRIDSAMVMGEKFSFTGKVEEPYSVYLMLPASQEYTTMWLENTELELSAEKGNFRNPVITGSEIQKDDDRLTARIQPFRDSRDSASAALAERTLTATERDSVNVFFNELRKNEVQATKDFVKENPNSVVSSYILNFYKTTWGKEATGPLYAGLSAERKASSDGKMIARYLEINKDVAVGDQYEDFAMTNARGETVRLSEVKDKYTLLHFWAAHCYFSQQENPNLVKNHERFKDHGFGLLGVSIDSDPETFSESIEEHNLNWTHVMSPEGKDNDAALIYGINGTPDNFLIDENGIIIARNIRGDKLTQKLEELMPAATEVAEL